MRRSSLCRLTAVLLCCALLLWAALPATDNFNRANGPVGANWTAYVNSFDVLSNACIPHVGNWANNVMYWSADSFNADQYYQAKILAATGWVCVRVNNVGGYCAEISGHVYAYYSNWTNYWQAGTFTAGSVGDTLRIEIVGSDITIKVNGASAGTCSDATYATGNPGLFTQTGEDPPTTTVFDDGEGGNVAAASGRRRIVVTGR